MVSKKWCLLITALAIVALFSFTSITADELEKAGAKVPKLASVLKELNDNYERGALTANETLIETRGLIVKDNKVRVMLDLMPGMTPDEAVLQRYGVEVERRHDDFWRVLAPIDALRRMAGELDGVRFIRKPMKPHPETGSATSEGVVRTNANVWHTAGFTGSGVSVAVIDGGFHWTCDAEGTNDIPTPNTKQVFGVPMFYDGGNCYAGDWHGTNVTDILIDMAPDVDLYLLRIGDESDLMAAKNYCVTNGIDIINMSLGFYNAGGYDGTGPLCDIVNDAHTNGILFVKSAGNNQNYHYMDMFADGDADGWHNFSGTDESNNLSNYDGSTTTLQAGWGIDIYLFWGWPTTTVDYDLYLYRVGVAGAVASSTNPQTGVEPGVEAIETTIPVTGQYYIKIQRAGGTGNAQLKFYTVGYRSEYRHSASSFSLPADAAGCFAVGARHQSGWAAATSVDNYSSFGPTLDGRIKPDIVGPSCVDISISTGCFGGTSAAAPHVAGAAALVMEACPTMDVDDVRDFLEGRAIDVAPAGKDNEWGWGKLDMGSPTDPCPGEESITVTAPNGGECWEIGSVHNIMWSSSGTSGLVDIEYTTNGGAAWTLAFDNTADDGSEPWTIPGDISTNCLVRITDADGDPSDMSNGVFSIQETCEVCEPELAMLTLVGYREVSWAPPLWTVQVAMTNNGPGDAFNVTARMNSDIPWLVIPDPDGVYGNIPRGGSSWNTDDYVFDLTAHPGGSFNVWFDVEYDDNCGNHHVLRLDPGFNPETHDETPALTYKLGQNYPNPFNPSTSISFQIPTAGFVNLNIYDAAGKLVRTLVDGHKTEGLHAVNWNGKDNNGAAVASGIYFYKLNAGSFVETKKMVLMR